MGPLFGREAVAEVATGEAEKYLVGQGCVAGAAERENTGKTAEMGRGTAEDAGCFVEWLDPVLNLLVCHHFSVPFMESDIDLF